MKDKTRQKTLFPTGEGQPTHHLPGTPGKLDVLRERLERGEELWHPEDRTPDRRDLR